MKYINPTYLDDNLTVETNIESFKKTSILFNQKIYKTSKNNKIDIIESKCKIVCIDTNHKIKAMPDAISKKFLEVK